MSLPIIVIGAGGHARVLIESLRRLDRTVAGIADGNPATRGTVVAGVTVIGGDDEVRAMGSSGIELVNGVGAVARYNDAGLDRRARIYNVFHKDGFTFASVIDPRAVVASDAVFGEGVQVLAGSIVQPGVSIGDNSIVNTSASVDHDCKIGPHVHVAPGAVLCGDVKVETLCYVGAGAIIIQGITIGESSLVAAGSVVSRPVAPRTTYDRG